jgi:hypothetical protein
LVFDDETVVAGVNRRHEEACFPGIEEPSRVGAISFNGSVISLSHERRQEHEIKLTEMFWCGTSLSQPLADFGICPVL